MKKTFILATLAGIALLAASARAEQSGIGHYTSGLFSDFLTMPPSQPGFTAGNFFLDYDHATFGKDLPLGQGSASIATGVTANEQAEVPVLMYAYPVSFHNVTFSSGVGIPFVWLTVKASATRPSINGPKGVSKQQSVSGLGDIQMMPIMAGWTNGDFKVGGIFTVWAPSGEYVTGRLANQGLGYWTFEPMLAFSWISTKIGTEFSVFSGVDFNTENTEANYQSGDIYHVDATLAQHLPLFGGIAGAGATAFYLKQITGDSGSGAKLGGFMAKSYGIGPTISYIHPIGKSLLIVDGSWLPQLHSDNTTKGNWIWLKVGLSF
jgi:hypothetical protein